MVTRRALFAGGAALLAAGCGPDGSSRLPPPQQALDAQLSAQEAVVRAYRGLRAHPPAVRRMAAAASAGADRLRAAGAKARPAAGGSSSLRAVLAAEQRALDANLAALRNGARPLRPLTTDLVVTGARHVAVLRGMLGDDPAPSALP